MKNKITSFLLVVVLIFLEGCNKQEFDEYYARPDNLEPPIYQVLESRGNFTNLLSVIDKAGYKDILSTAGYWTMFAPNDEAFQKFFQENSEYGSLEAIDSTTASKIVKYALVYNAFRTDHIADFQSPIGWQEDLAYKRRTAYYTGFQKSTINGSEIVTVASNRNNDANANYYVSGDNNNKYIPYFYEDYMQLTRLSAADYNYFFPDQTYTGFNVIDAQVVNADIIAENGVIDEVSRVNLPLPNFDQYLQESPQYSLFKSILEENLVSYIPNNEATHTYQTYTGNADQVFVKVYDPELGFSPNNENYLKESDNDAQIEGFTMFVPTNEVLQNFIDDILLKHYPNLKALPKYVFVDFFNAHMFQTTVWPSHFSSSSNMLEEEARFDSGTDVVDQEVLSNGIFYGTNKVQKSNLFYSVYTSAYLDPDYSLMTRALNEPDGYKKIISNIGRDYVLFMMSDETLHELGYDYNINRQEWEYTSPETGVTTSGSLAKSRILRVLYNHIAPNPDGRLNDLSGTGMFRSGDTEIPGEYIKFDNNTVYAAGNEDAGGVVHITGYEDQENGRVYYTDNILKFSEQPPAKDLKELAVGTDSIPVENSPYSYYYNYLKNSEIYDSNTYAIRGVDLGTKYTFIIPSNDAIQQAVRDSVLPGIETETGLEPNFAPSNSVEKEKVTKFLLYHILENRIVAADGYVEGLVETLLKDDFNNSKYVNVVNDPGALQFIGEQGRMAELIPEYSNNLADRSLIHLIDNYLQHNE
ncbi:hypothetical protein C7S20_10195 [Christiangramia fulva]|uniref:FAS1 domain-containing protein n=1 Tax=Christiangramia fulva TaxID=2126553 RepID=A0A2R3Z5R4_9FLAO|nr:fasciclin domain-containing protein [Christiangramia fulva]AVR45605.1 hypothetical protein C7S20_10195 [Christiangramia fulva]